MSFYKKIKSFLVNEKSLIDSKKSIIEKEEDGKIKIDDTLTFDFVSIKNYYLNGYNNRIIPSMKKNDERDYSIHVAIPLFERFIENSNRSDFNEIIEDLIGNNIPEFIKNKNNSLITIAKKINIKGYDLLKIKEPFNEKSLKKCYRKAAFNHHPDKGGSIENMKIINKAYVQFMELLATGAQKYDEDKQFNLDDKDFGISINFDISKFDYEQMYSSILTDQLIIFKNPDALISNVCIELLHRYNDLYEVDKAYKIINKIIVDEKLISNVIGTYFFANAIFDTGKKLVLSNKKELANELMKNLDISFKSIDRGSLNMYKSVIEKINKSINGKKPRFVLNHITQLDNCLKYGIINEDRYKLNLERINKKTKRN